MLDIPKKQLYELYINQGIELEALSVLYGKSKRIIHDALSEYGPLTLQRLSLAVQEKRQRYLSLYAHYRKQATERGYPFELTEDQFCSLVTRECHYCGRLPYTHADFKSIDWIGLDRADNTKGYTLENSRPCCGTCNMVKGSMSEQQFMDLALRIAAHQTG